jgi:hypothetical protein
VTQSEYENVSAELMTLALGIEDSKRPGYTLGNDDVLHNFKSVAKRLGITPEQAWGVYSLKHLDAICSIMAHPELPVVSTTFVWALPCGGSAPPNRNPTHYSAHGPKRLLLRGLFRIREYGMPLPSGRGLGHVNVG